MSSAVVICEHLRVSTKARRAAEAWWSDLDEGVKVLVRRFWLVISLLRGLGVHAVANRQGSTTAEQHRNQPIRQHL